MNFAHDIQMYVHDIQQRVAYAKVKSDIVSQRDGTFVARPKRKMDTKGESKGIHRASVLP